MFNLFDRDKDEAITASELWLTLRKLGYFGMSGAIRDDSSEAKQSKLEAKAARKGQLAECEQLIKKFGSGKKLQFKQFCRCAASRLPDFCFELNPVSWL